MIRTILTFGATNRILALAIVAAFTALAALGMPKLEKDTSRRTLISVEDPAHIQPEGIEPPY